MSKSWVVALAVVLALGFSCAVMADEGSWAPLPPNSLIADKLYEKDITAAAGVVEQGELLTLQRGDSIDAAYMREVAAAKAAHKEAWFLAKRQYENQWKLSYESWSAEILRLSREFAARQHAGLKRESLAPALEDNDRRYELAEAAANRDWNLAQRRADELYRGALRRAKRNLVPPAEDANTPSEKLTQKLKAVERAYENAEAAATDKLEKALAALPIKEEAKRDKARQVWLEEIAAAERKLCADTKQVCAGADWLANGLNLLAVGYNEKIALAMAVYRQMLGMADMLSAPHVRAAVEAGASAQCDAMCAAAKNEYDAAVAVVEKARTAEHNLFVQRILDQQKKDKDAELERLKNKWHKK